LVSLGSHVPLESPGAPDSRPALDATDTERTDTDGAYAARRAVKAAREGRDATVVVNWTVLIVGMRSLHVCEIKATGRHKPSPIFDDPFLFLCHFFEQKFFFNFRLISV
jgi:hypothetical protein